MAGRAHRRSRALVKCVRCGQFVAKDNAQFIDIGYVGGVCLQLALAQARMGEGVVSVGG